MKKNPYRVIVWAPSGVGRACLRVLLDRDDCEIVGVLAYSPEKNGKDVGELIDHPPIGVKVTTDKEAIFALEADAVLYAAMLPFDAAAMESDVIRLLESGKNVISAVAFHYAHNHGPAYVEKFEAACRKGKSCLHGTGENPGFWFERVALTFTGACSHVEHLQLHEFADLSTSGSSAELLAGVCFGFTAEQAAQPGPMDALWKEYYFVEIMNMGSIALFGRPLDRIEHTPKHYFAAHDIVMAKEKGDPIDMMIPKGRVHAMTHSFTGYLDGRPRITTSVNWFLRKENAPFPVKSEHNWLIEIEGKPVSLRCEIGAFASLTGDLEFSPGDPTSSTYYVTAIAMVQAIPVLCGHEPGIVYPSIFATSSTDLHRLEGRKTLVG
jgi:4-hydroxy-tetrahydrodipicolinate reductase